LAGGFCGGPPEKIVMWKGGHLRKIKFWGGGTKTSMNT
jgi:hypothetical protein